MNISLRESISVLITLFYFISIATAQTDGSIAGEKNNANITSNIQGSNNQNNVINGHVPGNQSYNLRVVLDHIFISKKNNSLEISENVVFRNEGPEIYYIKDKHTFFAISTPPDAKNLKTQAMECCLVQEEGVVYMDPMQTIKPGDNFEMQVSYTLVPPGNEYVFNKTALYNTTSLSIFVDKTGGLSAGEVHETLTLNGNDYYIVVFNDVSAGETVNVSTEIVENSAYLYAGIGFLFLFSIGMVYHYKEKLFKRRTESLEELELEKIRIFQAIHGFEKHSGTENSGEFNKLMDEYKLKAIRIFIKMDKIKKDREELLKNMDDNADLIKI